MPTSNQIADRSNKRFNGKAKTDDNRAFFEEPYSKVEKIFPTEIWTQSDLIPSTPSGFTPTNGEEVGVVRYNEVTLTLVNGTTKAFYHPLLANIIPFDFGDGISYGWTITHSTNGEILFGQGDWEVIDGVLVFNGTLPFSGGVLTMSFYSYIGQTLEKYKGYYDTLENLIIDYPNNIVTPSDRKGWFTIVDSIFYIWSVSDNQWKIIGGESDLISIQVYNNTASTINKGSAVYLTGGNNGDKPHVDLADSSNANKMPALGIVKENINPSSEGQVAVSGIINFNSHGFTAGANLFINGLGALQETAPTGEGSLIQKIGKVVSPNIILVQGAFRSNATPNLDDGNIFIGNVSNQASTTPFAISLDSTPQLSGDLDLNGHGISYASGLVITDALDEDDMSSDSSTAVPTQQSVKSYTDTGDARFYQSFSSIANTNFTIDFISRNWCANIAITSITQNLTINIANPINGSQFFITVRVASGQQNHELIFSGVGTPVIDDLHINSTSDGVILPGNASSATIYSVVGIKDTVGWIIWVTPIKE